MKFKKVTLEEYRAIKITDEDACTLEVHTSEGSYPGFNGMWFKITDGMDESPIVEVSRKKALKLAWAIIDELNPSQMA